MADISKFINDYSGLLITLFAGIILLGIIKGVLIVVSAFRDYLKRL
jgi:hypothetical protein